MSSGGWGCWCILRPLLIPFHTAVPMAMFSSPWPAVAVVPVIGFVALPLLLRCS